MTLLPLARARSSGSRVSRPVEQNLVHRSDPSWPTGCPVPALRSSGGHLGELGGGPGWTIGRARRDTHPDEDRSPVAHQGLHSDLLRATDGKARAGGRVARDDGPQRTPGTGDSGARSDGHACSVVESGGGRRHLRLDSDRATPAVSRGAPRAELRALPGGDHGLHPRLGHGDGGARLRGARVRRRHRSRDRAARPRGPGRRPPAPRRRLRRPPATSDDPRQQRPREGSGAGRHGRPALLRRRQRLERRRSCRSCSAWPPRSRGRRRSGWSRRR